MTALSFVQKLKTNQVYIFVTCLLLSHETNECKNLSGQDQLGTQTADHNVNPVYTSRPESFLIHAAFFSDRKIWINVVFTYLKYTTSRSANTGGRLFIAWSLQRIKLDR